MHICHLLASYAEYGGLEKHVIELASSQVRQGHQVSILASAEIAPRIPEGIETRVVRWKRSRRDPRLGWELVRMICELSPDVVHGHAHKVAALVPSLRSKLTCAFVGTAHNIKRRTHGFEAFDAVTAPSQQVVESLGGVPATVIWNSVPAFSPDWIAEAEALEPPFRGEGNTVLYAVGRLVEAKGFDLLLEAFAKLPTRAHLWLVGDGPDRAELGEKIKGLNLSERVWYPGSVSQNEAVGLMALADLFVISSRNEGGPYTMAEALRAKCPVMSTEVGLVPDFLEGEQLFEAVSADAIADGLQRFLTESEKYSSEMKPVFERANEELDLEAMARKVVAVYEKVLAK